MKVIINSNATYFPYAFAKISKCKSYIENKDKFLFIVGGSYKKKKNLGSNVIQTKINSLDFNGMIYLLQNKETIKEDKFFYTHDTCDFGDNFFNLLSDKFDLFESARLFAIAKESAFIGIYNKKLLTAYEEQIMKFYNTDKSVEKLNYLKTMTIRNESFLLRSSPSLCKERIVTGPFDVYSNNVPRISEFFPELDYYKFKANWFLKNNYELKI